MELVNCNNMAHTIVSAPAITIARTFLMEHLHIYKGSATPIRQI